MSLMEAGPRTSSRIHTRDRIARGRARTLSTPLWERLSPAEIRRRICHIAPGLLPFLLWHIPHDDPFSPALQGIVVVLTLGLGLFVYRIFQYIRREGEGDERLAACMGYAASVAAMVVLFPGHAELALMVLGVLAFGDGFATLGGMVVGGRRLPWNRRKSIAGTACFLVFGTTMAALVYWGEANNPLALPQHTPVNWHVAMLCGGFTCLAAAIAESVPSRINDNIRVGATASLAAILAQTIFVGWS
jgi:dolichol kinase